MSTYKVGNGTTAITIEADIDTFGLAASRAILIDVNTNDPEVTVGHSVDATGDISRRDIGPPSAIVNKRLSILTIIDLAGDEDAMAREADRIRAKYILDEGPDGFIVFSDPLKTVSDDGTRVILFKQVDLIS